MNVLRRWQAMMFAVVLMLLVAAVSYALAQEESAVALTTDQGVSAGITVGLVQAGTTGQAAAQEEFVSTSTTVTQTQPAPGAAASEEAVTLATPTTWLAERAWSDGFTTVVECITTGASRSCRVNVFGPGGEFILGREISASGLAFDCTGPCTDSIGATLDVSSVSRAQAAIAAGDHTVAVVSGTAIQPEVEAEAMPPEEVAEEATDEGLERGD